MKIIFAYLPLKAKGFLNLSQNRFASFRGDKELIYPIVPATLLTILKKNGNEVKFIDSIYEELNYNTFEKKLEEFQTEILIFESKTACIKENWNVINQIKEKFPKIIVVAVGDHVSVLPEETLNNSKVDYVLTGGDYDISTSKLVEFLEKKNRELPKGSYYKTKDEIKNTGKYELIENLDEIPYIDREIVPWKNYHESWRLHDEFTYIMASRGCPFRCTFCSWPQMLYDKRVRFRTVPNVMGEIELLLNKYGIKEIFFDDDTFNVSKKWVMELCEEIIKRNLKFTWGCNGRVSNCDKEMLTAMKKSGCRFIKFGVESASAETIERIKKGYTLEEVKKTFKNAKEVGILRHATAMLGYPWETKKDMQETINFIKKLDVDTVQFSIPVVYPGTELFREAKEKGWLKFKEGDWEKFDMAEPCLKSEHATKEEIVDLCKNAWKKIYFRPRYIIKRITNIRKVKDIQFLYRGTKSVLFKSFINSHKE